MEYKTEGSRDSIKLKDYLRILLRRKFLLLGIICATVAIVGIVSLSGPRVYTVETILQIGQIEGQNVESPVQVVEKITSGAFKELVASELKINAGDLPEIKARFIDNTQLVVMSTDVYDIERGKEILNALSTLITDLHQKQISDRREFFGKEIEQLARKQQIAESTFQKGLNSSSISETTQFLMMNYIQNRIDSLQNQINLDRKALYSINDTRVIKPPTNSLINSRISTIIILAGMLGLILGIFVVLFREWWDSAKRINA